MAALAVMATAAVVPGVGTRAQSRGEPAPPPRAIEDPTGSMQHFYQRLTAAEAHRRGAIARVAVYGESTNATDRVTSELRRRMQRRFGDAGKGFVPIAPGWPAQRHRDVEWEQQGRWRSWVVNRSRLDDDRYGLGGVMTTQRNAHARARFATVTRGPVGRAVSRYELFYQAWPGGGELHASIDGRAQPPLSTRSDRVTDRVYELRVPDGAHELELSPATGDESLHLYGVVMERERPGVVVDGLMLVGAFTRVLLQFDPEHWKQQIGHRQPDLIVFWMGGNDAASRTTAWGHGRYVRQYTQAVERARRGRPEASCLVVSVLDAGEEIDGVVRTNRRIPRIVRAQREVALATGCAFFDLFEAVGGQGTMARWTRSRPRMAERDYKHLTAAGSRQVGTILYSAIAAGYDGR